MSKSVHHSASRRSAAQGKLIQQSQVALKSFFQASEALEESHLSRRMSRLEQEPGEVTRGGGFSLAERWETVVQSTFLRGLQSREAGVWTIGPVGLGKMACR